MIQHLALIMDGNRRWAKKRALFPWLGHRQGVQNVEMVLKYCLEQSIPYVSLYTLSLENLNRTQQELSYLFALVGEVQSRVQEFTEQGVCVRFVGDQSKIPAQTLQVCEQIEQATSKGKKLQCNLLFCYGGQQEIVAAIRSLSHQEVANLDVSVFCKKLWLGDVPNPDLIIRTGGVQRLSNFLLFQAAYSEIRFLDCLWPDFTKELLHQLVCDVDGVQKNLGK